MTSLPSSCSLTVRTFRTGLKIRRPSAKGQKDNGLAAILRRRSFQSRSIAETLSGVVISSRGKAGFKSAQTADRTHILADYV